RGPQRLRQVQLGRWRFARSTALSGRHGLRVGGQGRSPHVRGRLHRCCAGNLTSTAMKSWHATSGGGLSSLTLREHDRPKPGIREVLVRVRANSLNFRELSVLAGTYPLPVKPDVVMCADGAGEIVELGPGVSRVKLGDRVAAAMFPRWIDGPFTWEVSAQ